MAVERLGPLTRDMQRLLSDPGVIDRTLAHGAERARAIAAPIVTQVKDIVGFLRP